MKQAIVQIKEYRWTLLALLFLCIPVKENIGQTIPQHFSYQGVLVDGAGVAYPDGTYNLSFRLYDITTGGSPLWEEQVSLLLNDGVFDALLGASNPIDLPFDKQYWLGIELEGESEMTPRLPLVAVPYALNAAKAVTADRIGPNGSGVVRSLNGQEGDIALEGEGDIAVNTNGEIITISATFDQLPEGTTDGEIIRWNVSTGGWEPGEITVKTSPRIAGDGSNSAPLDLAQMGATDGQALFWDDATQAWTPGTFQTEDRPVITNDPITGNGSTGDPIRLRDGENSGGILFWNGSVWTTSVGNSPSDGDQLLWDGVNGTWSTGQRPTSVETTSRLNGDGSSNNPIDLAQQGATDGQALRWDADANAWLPADLLVTQTPPFVGTGTAEDPLRLIAGGNTGALLYWNGTDWQITNGPAPDEGEILQWNAVIGRWEPTGINVTDKAPLTQGSLWVGDANDVAQQVEIGQANQVLVVNPAGRSPEWSSRLSIDSLDVRGIRVRDNITVEGDLIVNGTNVDLPDGSIDNADLANSSVRVSYGVGLSGDTTVALGGTLNVQNTGVTELRGTANQLIVDQSTGTVTLSLPQDIHTNATPTFDGLTLDNINSASSVDQVLVSNNGAIESRPLSSFFPGGLLPQGSTANNTLRWDGGAWVENTGLTADGSGNTTTTGNSTVGGDLTVGGTNVNLPNGSIDNVELANNSVNINYGTGLSGDASVALGGTLNVQNDGVTSANAGTGISIDQSTGGVTITNDGVTQLTAGNGVTLDQSTGDVTITNSGLLDAQAGTGIDVSVVNGTATITNHGVTSLSGTTNQVAADQSTGAITLTLPQDIHTDATPTFDGLTLDNISTASSADQIIVSNNGEVQSRSFTSLMPGGILPQGTSANSTLRWDGSNWIENTGVTADGSGNLNTSGNSTVDGDLTVNGTAVNLPNGSIDNTELANNSVNINYGTGLSGDASVTLGGTLTVQNIGVTSANAGTGISLNQSTGGITITNDGVTQLTAGNGIIVDQSTGAITVTNNGLLSATGGTGIDVTTTNGAATITNTGVTSLTGTTNQVVVDQSTGGVTLSLPQDIHTDATPTFDGLTLDNITTSSSADQIVVSNSGSFESRSLSSFFPGGLLPQGTTNNSTLRWDGANWVENTGLTSDATGNTTTSGNTIVGGGLTVNGANVDLPNGSIDNAELANNSVNVSYGTGLSGDASVTLGGTLNVQNDGVTSASGGTGISVDQSTGGVTITNDGVTSLTAGSGIIVDQSTGGVTITNNGLLSASAGTGIDLSIVNDTAVITNNGVTSLSGTANQVVVDQSTGGVTLSLPQDIHTDATPTFDGLTLDNINNTSTATDLLVSNAGSLESRPFSSLISSLPLAQNALFVGNGSGIAAELGSTNSPGAILQQNLSGTPVWTPIDTLISAVNDSLAGSVWLTTGNSGTDPANNFIGTTDSTALVIRVNNDTVMRYLPSVSPIIIGGSTTNNVQNRSFGSVVGGGDRNLIDSSTRVVIGGGDGNEIRKNSHWGTIGGGTDNEIDSSSSTVISGGRGNMIQNYSLFSAIGGGIGNAVNATSSGVVSGGWRNRIDSGDYSMIGGGNINQIDGSSGATIGGGVENQIIEWTYPTGFQWGARETIGGGYRNRILGSIGATVGGGYRNRIDSALYSTVGGGILHYIEGHDNTIGGGRQDTILNSSAAVVAGGSRNSITNSGAAAILGGSGNRILQASTSVISGGIGNSIDSSSGPFIGGGRENSITSGHYSVINGGFRNRVSGSVIGGYGTVGGGIHNTVSNRSATVGGGEQNTASSLYATVGGGISNTASGSNATVSGGDSNSATGSDATIGGGENNVASSAATVGGGRNNIASNSYATIGGGFNDTASGRFSTVSGGEANVASSSHSTVGGGRLNVSSSVYTTVGGGVSNVASDWYSTVSGGIRNTASDRYTTIGGGELNTASSDWATIAGGRKNIASGWYSTVAGGDSNAASGSRSVIGGGEGNTASSGLSTVGGGWRNSASSANSTVGGGNQNVASERDATVAGGSNNVASGLSAIVGGGFGNTASGVRSIVGGGENNTVSSSYATISGGSRNVLTGFTSAIPGGRGLTLSGDGSFGFLGNPIGTGFGSNRMTVSEANVALFGNTDLWLANNNNAPSQLRFYEAEPDTGTFPGTGVSQAHYTSFESPTLSDTIEYVLPDTAGIVGDVLAVRSVVGDRVILDWDAVSSSTSINVSDSAWSLTGNGGISPSTQFIGTTDNQTVVFRVNNDTVMRYVPASSPIIIGGRGQSVSTGSIGSIIAGGVFDTIAGTSQDAVISGGIRNVIDNASYSTIVGGDKNRIENISIRAFVGGGISNSISDTSSNSMIGGGSGNTITGLSSYGVLGGGLSNRIERSAQATITGGINDTISVSADAIIGGGRTNSIDSSVAGVISGGNGNRLRGSNYSAIPGGREMRLQGDRSFGFNGNNATGTRDMSVDESNVAVLANVDLWLANNDNGTSQLRFYESNNVAGAFPGTTTYYSSFEAGNQTDTIEYVLPTAVGAAGDVLEIAVVNGDQITLEWDTDDNSSDARFKSNVRSLTNALDSLLMLRGVRHDWQREEFPNRHFPTGESIGFIAQEVEKIFPELVETESDGYKKVHYAKVTALLVEALREERTKVEEQEERLHRLYQENRELRNIMIEIEKRLQKIEREHDLYETKVDSAKTDLSGVAN